MIKTNIKMIVTPEQSKRVQEICFENGIYWAGENKNKVRIYSNYLYIRGLITHDTSNNFIYFNDAKEEEIDADLFIKTNGTCILSDPLDIAQDFINQINKETYLTKYTSQPKDLESALKKIENLHIALNKKVDKNKNQALEITKLLEQKKDLQEALSTNYKLIEKFTKIGVKYENKLDENKKTIERLNSIVEYLSKQLGLKVF